MIILEIIKIIACFNILIAIFSFVRNKNFATMLHISVLCDNMGCFIFIIASTLGFEFNLIIAIKLVALLIILIASGVVTTSLISILNMKVIQ